MEPLYKQRLVGAVVLVAFAVVVIPLVLGEPRRDRPDPLQLDINVPPAPTLEPRMSPAPDADTTAVGLGPDADLSSAVSSGSNSDTPESNPAADTVWVVEAASFKVEAEALALVTRLRGKALEAWLAAPSQATGRYRVLIGPELKRTTADGLSQRLKREFKLNATVQVYALD